MCAMVDCSGFVLCVSQCRFQMLNPDLYFAFVPVAMLWSNKTLAASVSSRELALQSGEASAREGVSVTGSLED